MKLSLNYINIEGAPKIQITLHNRFACTCTSDLGLCVRFLLVVVVVGCEGAGLVSLGLGL